MNVRSCCFVATGYIKPARSKYATPSVQELQPTDSWGVGSSLDQLCGLKENDTELVKTARSLSKKLARSKKGKEKIKALLVLLEAL